MEPRPRGGSVESGFPCLQRLRRPLGELGWSLDMYPDLTGRGGSAHPH